jgi:hypothetical protein
MEFVDGFSKTKKENDYMFLVFDRFNKISILMPCKKSIKAQDETNMFFE